MVAVLLFSVITTARAPTCTHWSCIDLCMRNSALTQFSVLALHIHSIFRLKGSDWMIKICPTWIETERGAKIREQEAGSPYLCGAAINIILAEDNSLYSNVFETPLCFAALSREAGLIFFNHLLRPPLTFFILSGSETRQMCLVCLYSAVLAALVVTE